MARPIPRVAPVTMARFPLSPRSMRVPLYVGLRRSRLRLERPVRALEEREEKERQGRQEQRERHGPLDEDPEVAVRDHDALAERDLELRAKHEAEEQRRALVGPAPQDI